MSRPLALIVFAVMTVFFGCFFVYPIWAALETAFIVPGAE
jgi:hypothetical protein